MTQYCVDYCKNNLQNSTFDSTLKFIINDIKTHNMYLQYLYIYCKNKYFDK